MKILVVEDEPTLNKLISNKLSQAYYNVDSCMNGDEALDHLEFSEYDAVVMDIMVPGTDGLSVLRKMRAAKNLTPVLLLTAKDHIEDRVTGLDAGADDYLVKPFSFEELMARLRVLIRRKSENLNISNVFSLEDLSVDCDRHLVMRSGKEISLSSREFSVLEYLIRNKGIVLSRDKIGNHIWNYDYEGGSNVVDVYIRYLRKKIDEGHQPKLIQTVRGAGYVLRAEDS